MREGPRESLAQPLRAWKVCRKIRGITASPRSGRCCVLGVSEGCGKKRTNCNKALASFCAAEGRCQTAPRFKATWPAWAEGEMRHDRRQLRPHRPGHTVDSTRSHTRLRW